MKFSHSLKFNAVPEWSDHYLNYSGLKKVIYKIQQDQLNNAPQDGGYPVWQTNNTTVSELADEIRQQQRLKNHHNDVQKSKDEARDEKKFGGKLMSRFRRNKGDRDDEKNVGSLAVEFGWQNEDEKNVSTESFTIEADNVTLFSLATGKAVSDPKSPKFDPLRVFTKQLLKELAKIGEFYAAKEMEVFADYVSLLRDIKSEDIDIEAFFPTKTVEAGSNPAQLFRPISSVETEKQSENVVSKQLEVGESLASDYETSVRFNEDDDDDDEDDEDEDDDDDDYHHRVKNSALFDHADINIHQQRKITLKKRAVELFIALSELKSFIELNRIGFTKITKKFDKTCNYKIKHDFIENFLPLNSKVFSPETLERIDSRLNVIVKVYSILSGQVKPGKGTSQDIESIKTQLKSHLRDHIVWERNTVWKDLLSLEKNSYNLNIDKNATQSNKMGDEGFINIINMHWRTFKIPFGWKIMGYDYYKLPAFLFTWQVVKILIIVTTFVVLLCVKTFNDPEQGRCLAVLVAAAMMWASEAIPLYVTAMLVPFLVVVCKVLKDEKKGGAMDGPAAASYILSTMWSSVIMLLLGGFTLAGALSKYNIAKILSSYILYIAGKKPRNVLLAIMCVSLFLSMWISNVAAPVLCFSLIQPVLRTIPTESPFAQALVLGIALSSNIAGMASPIASPQNMVAIESMTPNPGWGKWFAVALPVSIAGMLGMWVELFLTFKISDVKLQRYRPIKERFTIKQIYISLVTIATIILWCLMTKIEGGVGSSGIVSIIPIVLFFGTGLLKTEDLNNFPWSIVLLAMGGIALGKAVSSSGLLATIAKALQRKIENFDVFVIMLIFGILVLVFATFVSHTVAALIIIPLVKEVGDNLPKPHPLILVMCTALIASAAMALPTSGFPNVTAISMTDEVGKRYLSVNTFITRGIPASIIAYVCVISLGYGIMYSLNF